MKRFYQKQFLVSEKKQNDATKQKTIISFSTNKPFKKSTHLLKILGLKKITFLRILTIDTFRLEQLTAEIFE